MKRYYMRVTVDGIVPEESPEGQWAMWVDTDAQANTLRSLQMQVAELTSTGQRDAALLAAAREEIEQRKANSYPHMCRDNHPQIGHAIDGEMCPVCIERGLKENYEAERDALKARLDALDQQNCETCDWLSQDMCRCKFHDITNPLSIIEGCRAWKPKEASDA